MDDKKRRELIQSFNLSSNFDSNYSETNRLWFLEKVIRGLEAEGKSDSEVAQLAQDTMQKATTLVKANRDFTLAVKAAGNPRFTRRALADMQIHRVQILYGEIAFHRAFVEPANLSYLLFVARRRFRTICRMFFWVNPNIAKKVRQGYFAYPHRCTSDQTWRVNEDAAAVWELKASPDDIPIGIKAGEDPAAAIQKLFEKRTNDPCKGNLFDCAVVADIMFVDSLLEAKDPDQFLPALTSSYLYINHMDNSDFTMSQADTENVLKRVPIPMPPQDLQVGDQCYIYNHPLYKTFRPTGSWTGEFSFVYVSGDRNYRSQKGFVFGGHGKNGTLFQFYADFVSELTTYLSLARRLAAVHLKFMAWGASAIAPGTVHEAEGDVKIFDVITESYGPAVSHQLLEYSKVVEARDFKKIPTKTKPRPKSTLPNFLVVQSKTDNIFYLVKIDHPDEDKPLQDNLKKKIADIPASKELHYPIKFKRIDDPPIGTPDSEVYAIENWGVAYIDRATKHEKLWPFFVVKDGKLQRNELKNEKDELNPDLFDAPFALFNTHGTDIEVFQPKIDFAAHKTFLSNNHAI